jgi:hypothetical protein
LLEKHSKIALRRSLSKTAVSLSAAPGGHEFTFHNKFVEIYKLYPGKKKSKILFEKFWFLWSRYGAGTGTGTVTFQNRNRNRNHNFSKVGPGTGTLIFQKLEPEP